MDKAVSKKSYQNSENRSHQKVFGPLMLHNEACASLEHDGIAIECDEASKEIVMACEAEETEENAEDESAAIPQPPHEAQLSSPGRKSNRQPKQPRSYSPSLLADGKKTRKRRKTTPGKRRETERPYDKLSDGSPFCCDLCGSAYVCKPSRKSRPGKVSRHKPYPRFGTDPKTGKTLIMCNACGLALNRPSKKMRFRASRDPCFDQCEKEKYLKDAKEFGESLAQQLNEPLAERLYCPKFIKKACGCIQTYILGLNSGNIDSAPQRAQELLEILKAAKELASLKFYDTGVPIPKPKSKRGTIGLGCGQRRSKIFEAFVLKERRKLKEGKKLHDGFSLCELACQRLLCYSNNFLHKKLKTVEGVKRVTRTKGKLEMGLLKPIHELPQLWCCGDRCSRMAISHGSLLQRWRSQAKEGQADARRVLAEMLTPAGGARPNCYRFIAMVTGCSSSTISRVNEQMRETGGDREPPVHGLKKYWENKPKKPKQGKKEKPAVYTELIIPSSAVQNQLHQNQILHHAAVTKDGKKIVTQRSLLKNTLNKVDGLAEVSSAEIHCETNVSGSILEPFQVISNQTSLTGQHDNSITIQLAPTYAQTMEHYQVLAQNSNHGSVQFANVSGPLNLSTHLQGETVNGDGLQNPVLGNGQNVFSVPLGQAITSLAGDVLATGEVLPRYSDVVALKKKTSEDVRNTSRSNNEKKQEVKAVPISSLGLPIVSSSGLPTDGDTVPVTDVLSIPLADALIVTNENTSNTIKTSDIDSETILAKTDEKGSTSASVQLTTPNLAQMESKKDILLEKAGEKQPVSLLPSQTTPPQVLQRQYQQLSPIQYGNSIHYVTPQPGTLQLIPAPNGGFQILNAMCFQPQGQIIQVISPQGGPTVVGAKSTDPTPSETDSQQLSTEQATAGTNATSDINDMDVELGERDTGERRIESNEEESPTVMKETSKVNAPAVTGQLPKATVTGSLKLPPDQLGVGSTTSEMNNSESSEKDTLVRRNDSDNDESPVLSDVSAEVGNSVLGPLPSQPPVSSSGNVNSSPGEGVVLGAAAPNDDASVSGQSDLTKKTAGDQKKVLRSPAKISDLTNSVFVTSNPSVASSMQPKFIQVPVSPPGGGAVQLMTVPVCSSLMKFAPATYQLVNSNVGIASAPPMNVAGNIHVVGNPNRTCTQFLTPDGKLQIFPQQAGTVVVPALGQVQMTSLGGARPLSFVQAANSQLMSAGNKNVQMVSSGSLRMTNGGVQFLNPNLQPIPRSPPPKYRSPLKSTKGALIKKDIKNLTPKPLTVTQDPVGQVVSAVTTASTEKPTIS